MYICVLDFEATCDNKKYVPHEIIEFPSVLVKICDESIIYISEFQLYCLPKDNPILSDYCIKLTGITQDQVDNGVTFVEALQRHSQWLKCNIPDFNNEVEKNNFVIMTFTEMDMEKFAVDEFKRYNIKPAEIYSNYVDIKKDFTKIFKIGKKFGLIQFLEHIGTQFEGRQHSGLADCKNTVKLLQYMVTNGYNKAHMKINKIKM